MSHQDIKTWNDHQCVG